MNIERFAEFIVGVGVTVLLVWIITKRSRTDGGKKTEYDERQKITRGIGYQYGFYAFMIYFGLLICADILELTIPASNTVISFTGVIIAGFVLSWYCIMHDAYWGMNSDVKLYSIFFVGIGALNLLFAVIEMVHGEMIINGILQNTFVNFEAGILILGIGLMLLIKKRRDKQEEGLE